MRIVFLIPDFLGDSVRDRLVWSVLGVYRIARSRVVKALLEHPGLHSPACHGGTLNIMRNVALVRSLGVDGVLATPSGKDTYQRFNVVDVPFIRWSQRSPDDLCVVPDFCTDLIDEVKGPVIAYLQSPAQLRADFDYMHPRVTLWTDSPFMLEKCRQVYPGKDIAIVPNIVDPKAFPFRPQSAREQGLLFAFPRKGPEFIEATRQAYAALGGTYWRFELIDGLTLNELALAMQRPQVFLASGEVEGCALPPQESMAAGIVVVGKSARGANFSMVHRGTAMVAETPEAAAQSLREIEQAELRESIARDAHAFIRRYFPDGEPRAHWLQTLKSMGVRVRDPEPPESQRPSTLDLNEA